jgi:hypothetical protein
MKPMVASSLVCDYECKNSVVSMKPMVIVTFIQQNDQLQIQRIK